jgi:hypothetical protein
VTALATVKAVMAGIFAAEMADMTLTIGMVFPVTWLFDKSLPEPPAQVKGGRTGQRQPISA